MSEERGCGSRRRRERLHKTTASHQTDDIKICDNFYYMISRRRFVAASALSGLALPGATKKIPVGLEMYSVRGELMKDLPGTVRAVAKMGYGVMEFYAPYFQWTTDYAKDVRKQMDDLGVRCNSTHNNAESFTPEGIEHAIELNQILGAKYIVMASPGRVAGLDGWKALGERLTALVEKLKPLGMSSGYHNHETEWPLVDGKRPMDVLAANTPKDVHAAARRGHVRGGEERSGGVDQLESWAHQEHSLQGLGSGRKGRATACCSARAILRGPRFSRPPRASAESSIT